MQKDDEAARKDRAQRLKDQVKGLKSRRSSAEDADQTASQSQDEQKTAQQISPREFVQRRMRELDSLKKRPSKRRKP